MSGDEEKTEMLYRAFAKISNPAIIENLLADLCTAAEVEKLAGRLWAAKLLIEGKTYAQVMEETDISSATLSRVSNCVRRGKGGYRAVWETEAEDAVCRPPICSPKDQ